jgi:hypothetical protein
MAEDIYKQQSIQAAASFVWIAYSEIREERDSKRDEFMVKMEAAERFKKFPTQPCGRE